MPRLPNGSDHSRPTVTPTASATLTGKLQSLTASERSEMEQIVTERGEAYVLAQWGTLIEQLRYINAL